MPVLEAFEKPDDSEAPTMTEAHEKAFDEFDALNSIDENVEMSAAKETPTPDSQS
jgi:GTP-binding protein HflX